MSQCVLDMIGEISNKKFVCLSHSGGQKSEMSFVCSAFGKVVGNMTSSRAGACSLT